MKFRKSVVGHFCLPGVWYDWGVYGIGATIESAVPYFRKTLRLRIAIRNPSLTFLSLRGFEPFRIR